MCGICGIVDWSSTPASEEIRPILDSLAHRGPDGEGVHSFDTAVLGHRRLAVIDLSESGKQPMCSANGEFAITFNGEIYNFQQLRLELERLGVKLRSRSDTEVFVEGFSAWGPGIFPKLRGMFAAAIWCVRSSELVLVRDRMGKKPLFFHASGSAVVFSSELQSLTKSRRVPKVVDPNGILQYLSLGYVLPPDSILSGVQRVAPGTYLTFKRGEAPVRSEYWSLATILTEPRRSMSDTEATDEFLRIFDEAAALRRVGDVPIGTFLSGGIDSSAVTASLAKGGPVRSFSIGFEQADFDESSQARSTAEFLNSTVESETITGDHAKTIPDILGRMGEPIFDDSLVPCFFLSRLARKRCTVILSGDGSDELFGGYSTYAATALGRYVELVPAPVFRALSRGLKLFSSGGFGKVTFSFKANQFFSALGFRPRPLHAGWRRLFTPGDLEKLVTDQLRRRLVQDPVQHRLSSMTSELPRGGWLDIAQYLDFKSWLANDILVKVDHTSMLHGLEVRSPFLDHLLVEFVLSLPAAQRYRILRNKWMLRDSQVGRLPAEVINRRKSGFNSPVNHWLNGVLRAAMEDMLRESPLSSLINMKEVGSLYRAHRERFADHSYRLFGLLSLHHWLAKNVS